MSDRLTDDDLAAIKARVEAFPANARPWHVDELIAEVERLREYAAHVATFKELILAVLLANATEQDDDERAEYFYRCGIREARAAIEDNLATLELPTTCGSRCHSVGSPDTLPTMKPTTGQRTTVLSTIRPA